MFQLQGSTDVTSRGVCTSTDIYTNTPTSTAPSYSTSSACHTSHNENPTCLTPHRPSSTCLTPHSASPTCLTPNSASPTCLIPHRASPLGPNSPCLSPTNNPLINGNESLTKMQHYKNSCDDRPSHTKDNLRRSCRKREGSTRKSHSRDTYKENHRLSQSKQHQQVETSHNHGKNNHPTQITHHNGRNRHMETSPASKINHTENSYHHNSNKHTESPHQNNRDSKVRDDCIREDPSRDNHSQQQTARESTVPLREPTAHRSRSNHHKRLSYQELDGGPRGGAGQRNSEFLDKASGASVKQELLHLSLARQALLAEKDELSRLLEHRENVITELRQQIQQRDRTIQAQRAHLDDALRHTQNGKRGAGVQGESPGGRNSGGQREDVQLVRDAIMSLRGNFRETDPTQHTIDTLEQAIAVLLERSGGNTGASAGGGGSLNHSATDKSPRSNNDKRSQLTGVGEAWTKVIYFTERTVTPFMSTVGKPLGEVKLRDFKAMFDRPGSYRFHFKSNDPEYGMVKEEVVNDDDILPGVDGKIIAWVEEDTE
ncbi:hypothetical protein Pcinc_031834 [Petrolisthes cinctipes]|uniref:DIX domain-containing protein n=1 Tax=Petrolisthes cinctipes TaxID=88211 RepID=A0AAE1EVS9_PETCI|nr:hypothetical protein Pcinc_031834 [Petrolisthes cinctipes]